MQAPGPAGAVRAPFSMRKIWFLRPRCIQYICGPFVVGQRYDPQPASHLRRPLGTKRSAAMKTSPTSPARVLAGSLLVLVMAATGVAPAGPGLAAAPTPIPQKSLIYAGWYGNTIPTPSFIASHFDFLESQPFNGLVMYLRNASMSINASTGVMTNNPMTHTAIASVLDPVRNLPFSQLQDNFGFIMGNDPPDFFDDWSVPIQNFRNLARALHDAGLKGFVFDNEQYFAPWAN